MLDIQQKRKLRTYMYSRVTLALLFLIVLLAMHSTWSVYKKKRESQVLLSVSENRVIELRDRESDLDSKIKRLDTEVGLEEEIRSKFSVAKENEAVVIVVEQDKKIATSTKNEYGFWSRIVNFFRF